MVAVRNHEADRYITGLPDTVSVFLVFGPDTGLVRERVNGILDKVVDDRHDPFQMVALAGDDIADDPGLLIDETRTIGLFQSRRAILVTAGRKSFVDAIRILLDEPPGDCAVVVSAGVLRADAPLRATCSRAKTAAAIECYPDQDRDIARLIDQELGAANLRITAEGRNALVAALGADRLTTRAEISKLVLYAHGRGEIGEEDIYAIVTGAAGHGFEDAVDAAFLGKRIQASETYYEVAATGEDLSVLVSAILRRCYLLHRMLVEIEAGTGRDHAMQKFGQTRLPPVRKNNILAQLNTWNSRQVMTLLDRLQDMAFKIRADSAGAPHVAARMLWTIATSKPGPRAR